MDKQEVFSLLEKVSVLMAQFERRCEQIERNQNMLAERLQSVAEHIPGIVKNSTDNHLRQISQETASSAKQGLGEAVSHYEKSLSQSGHLIQAQASTLGAEIRQLKMLHNHMMWKVVVTVAFCMLLVIAGGIYLSMHYRRVIEQNQISAELLQAYNRADVVLCEGRLCVNIDPNSKAYGDGKRQYRQARDRPANQKSE